MANDITKNPWVLDTAGTITTDLVYLKKLEYYSNAGDNDLLVKDNSGSSIWNIRATIAATNNDSVGICSEDFGGAGKIVSGFILTTIDGGTLKVHIS